MNTDYRYLQFEQNEHVGILTLNRPDKLNALNEGVLTELRDFLEQLKKESSLRVLLFTGAGEKAFIAGADVAFMSKMSKEEAFSFALLGQKVSLLFEQLSFPVIACVNGFALGGGCEMAMACDFILATESSLFGQPEVKLGLIPGFGGTQRLAKYIGRNAAKELIYTARMIKAHEAHELGLVLKIYKDKETLLTEAKKMAKAICLNGPLGIAGSKTAINQGVDLSTSAGLEIEARAFADVFDSNDMQEGTKAFLEKRLPSFTGK